MMQSVVAEPNFRSGTLFLWKLMLSSKMLQQQQQQQQQLRT
jgi:hypothetical protein